jgi:hypothetical protein
MVLHEFVLSKWNAITSKYSTFTRGTEVPTLGMYFNQFLCLIIGHIFPVAI